MLQTEAMVMGTELSRLRATAHSNTQVGITSWPGAIKVSHPREFPGRTGFYRHLLCQKLPTVDRKKKYKEMSCQLPTRFSLVGIFFLKK